MNKRNTDESPDLAAIISLLRKRHELVSRQIEELESVRAQRIARIISKPCRPRDPETMSRMKILIV